MRALRGVLILPVVAVAGCGTIRQMVTDMQHIQACARERSGAEGLNFNIGGAKRFTIGLVNAPLDTLPGAAKSAAARRVAECVRDNYSRFNTLNEVAVVFTHRTTAGPAKVSTSGEPIVFTTRDLTRPAGASDSTAGQAKASN